MGQAALASSLHTCRSDDTPDDTVARSNQIDLFYRIVLVVRGTKTTSVPSSDVCPAVDPCTIPPASNLLR